jgi:hypothetical protein
MGDLGDALLGQGRYDEAQPLIIEGYEGLEARQAKIPAPSRARVSEATERVVRLYDSWGNSDRAAAWKIRLGMPGLPADVFARP